MFADDEMIMLSALQHYVFCPRQCGLIHIEQIWTDNYLTVAGKILHEHVDTAGHQTRKTQYTATAVRLVSKQLGLTGIADMLEFHQVDTPCNEAGLQVATRLKGRVAYWIPFPVEYKHGRPKEHQADEIQLCAQALCLEEMLNVTILKGALFYGKTRRRVDIEFDKALRVKTMEIIRQVHNLIAQGITPPAVYGKGCEACSLIEACRPRELTSSRSVKKWIDHQITNALEDK